MSYYGINVTGSVLATCRRQRQLGRELRRIFDDILDESVPNDMLRLLNEIDSKDEPQCDWLQWSGESVASAQVRAVGRRNKS